MSNRIYSVAFIVLGVIVMASTPAAGNMTYLMDMTRRNAEAMGHMMEDVKLLLSARRTDSEKNIYPATCLEASRLNPQDGLVTLQIPVNGAADSKLILTAYCEQNPNAPDQPWLVLMRRIGTKLNNKNFPSRSWSDYEKGFGNPTRAFWIGLEKMHLLTRDEAMVLRVDLEDWDGNSRYAEYRYFRISSEIDGYRLFVDGYSGDAGDALGYHNGQRFSTKEKDRDVFESKSCAETYNAAWWFNACFKSILTGTYYEKDYDNQDDGVIWNTWIGSKYSFKMAQMKIRPLNS